MDAALVFHLNPGFATLDDVAPACSMREPISLLEMLQKESFFRCTRTHGRLQLINTKQKFSQAGIACFRFGIHKPSHQPLQARLPPDVCWQNGVSAPHRVLKRKQLDSHHTREY